MFQELVFRIWILFGIWVLGFEILVPYPEKKLLSESAGTDLDVFLANGGRSCYPSKLMRIPNLKFLEQSSPDSVLTF